MDNNLITHFSEIFASNLESRIIIPHPPTHKKRDKQKLQTDPCWKSSRLLRGQSEYGQTNYQVFYGLTRRPWGPPTRKTPFKLAYGSEVVILAEVHMANHRVMKDQDEENEKQLHFNHDLINEVRMDVEQKTARYKSFMTWQYDVMVKLERFNIGDLVLKRVSLATKNLTHGKLGSNWEGPYRIINCKRQGSYYLEALDRQKLEHPWNVEHLRRYYQWKVILDEHHHGRTSWTQLKLCVVFLVFAYVYYYYCMFLNILIP